MIVLLATSVKAEWSLVWDGSSFSDWNDEHNSDGCCNSWEEPDGSINISCTTGCAHTGGGMYTDYNFTYSGRLLVNFSYMLNPNSNADVGDTGMSFMADDCWAGTDCRDTSYYWCPTGHAIQSALKAGCGWWDNAAILADDAGTAWHCGWEFNAFRNSTAYFPDDTWITHSTDMNFDTGNVTVYIDNVKHGNGIVDAAHLAGVGTAGEIEMHLSIYPYNANNQSLVFKDFMVYEYVPECNNVEVSSDLTLTENVEGNCYFVTGSDVEFDCKGYDVNGYNESDKFAINVSNVENFNLTNCNFYGYIEAIDLGNVTNWRVVNNTFNDAYYESSLISDYNVFDFDKSSNGYFSDNNFSNIVINGTEPSGCYNDIFSLLYLNELENTTINTNDFGDDVFMVESRDSNDAGGCQPAMMEIGYNLRLVDVNYTYFVNSDITQSRLAFMYDTIGDNNYILFNETMVYGQTISSSTDYVTVDNCMFNMSKLSVSGATPVIMNSNFSLNTLNSATVILGTTSDNAVIDNIRIENQGGSYGISASGADNVSVTNSYFYNMYNGNSQGGAGIVVLSCDKGLIANNLVDVYNASGLYGGAIHTSCTRIKVVNNTMQNSTEGSGIVFYLSNYDVQAVNNTIVDAVDWDIYNVVSQNLTLINNSLNKSNIANYPLFEGAQYMYRLGYYVDVDVNWTNNSYAGGANVTSMNNDTSRNVSKVADDNGHVTVLVYEYETFDNDVFYPQDGGDCWDVGDAGWTCYTPHNFTANHSSVTNETRVEINSSGQSVFMYLFSPSIPVDPCVPPIVGNWTITDNCTLTGENYTVNGNISITERNSLTLNGSNISINSTYTNEYYIDVDDDTFLELQSSSYLISDYSVGLWEDYGVLWTGGLFTWVVNDSYIENIYKGGRNRAHYVNLTSSTIVINQTCASYWLYLYSNKNTQITDNVFQNDQAGTEGVPGGCHLIIVDTNNTNLSENTFNGAVNRYPMAAYNATNMTVVGNDINCSRQCLYFVGDYANNTLIKDNNLSVIGYDVILLWTGKPAEDVTITGNIITSSGTSYRVLLFKNIEDVNITNNTISGDAAYDMIKLDSNVDNVRVNRDNFTSLDTGHNNLNFAGTSTLLEFHNNNLTSSILGFMNTSIINNTWADLATPFNTDKYTLVNSPLLQAYSGLSEGDYIEERSTLRINVTYPNGTPIESCTVTISNSTDDVVNTGSTGVNGTYYPSIPRSYTHEASGSDVEFDYYPHTIDVDCAGLMNSTTTSTLVHENMMLYVSEAGNCWIYDTETKLLWIPKDCLYYTNTLEVV